LFIAASNAYVPTFDNLSDLPGWLSDMLARLATGGGFGTRQLYSDDEEKLFEATRPVLLGAIENVIWRGDLADRALLIKLEPIPDNKRRREREFWASFEAALPNLLGALLDAVVRGLKALPDVELAGYPRMADFAEWATACEPGLWEPGTFAAAYAANRENAMADVVEANLVGAALQAFMANRDEWSGTATELLDELNDQIGDEQRRNKFWPKAANALSGKLTRLGGDLRKLGIEIADEGREPGSRRRRFKITRVVSRERSFGSFDPPPENATEPETGNDPNDPNDLFRTSTPDRAGVEFRAFVRAKVAKWTRRRGSKFVYRATPEGRLRNIHRILREFEESAD
jgi:hypothetical protein